jgi:ParB/RepB/Spo0J family partition protein
MADPVSTADAVALPDPPEPEPAGAPAPDREYALVPLDRIQMHPLNLRRELRDIDELADSIRENGLLEPVLVVPAAEAADDGDELYVLIAGHRRHAACLKARHSPIESIIRRDLDSDGAQVIAMLTENGPRDDLTPIEEAHGYQLALSLNGLTPAKLAKRLGKPRAAIASRVALTKLPEPVQDRVHSRQITLVEADALVEFAGDRQVFDELLSQVGDPNFRYQVERERHKREQRAKITQLRGELEATGVRVIDPPAKFSWGSMEQPVSYFADPDASARDDGSPERFTPAAHAAACSFHAVFVDPHDIRPVYVCTNPDEARHIRGTRVYTAPINPSPPAAAAVPEPTPEQTQAAQEAERAEEKRRAEARRQEAQRREALEVAGRLRTAFLTSTVQRSGRAHLAAVLKLLLTDHFLAWLGDADLEDVQELAGLIDARLSPEPNDDDGAMDDRLEQVTHDLQAALDSRRTPDALAGALLAIAAQDREYALRDGFGWGDERCRRYVEFLIAQGYEPTPFERELLDRYDPDTSDVPAVATA